MLRKTTSSLRQNKNALVAIVPLALLLFMNVGFVATYHVAKMRWYQQQLQSKPGEETATLRMSKEQFYNGTEEYEWKIDGESYDMRSFTETDSGIVVIAVHDPYEHELMNIITAGFADERSETPMPFQSWVKFFASPILPVERATLICFHEYSRLEFPTKPFISRLHSPELIHPPTV